LALKEDLQNINFGRLIFLAILKPFRVIAQNALRMRASEKVETYQEKPIR